MEFNEAFVIQKKQTVELGNGLKVTFDAHSHKRVMIGGPPSPLIVYMTFELGSVKESASFNVHMEEGPAMFSWKDYTFEIKGHEYDRAMTLVVTRVN